MNFGNNRISQSSPSTSQPMNLRWIASGVLGSRHLGYAPPAWIRSASFSSLLTNAGRKKTAVEDAPAAAAPPSSADGKRVARRSKSTATVSSEIPINGYKLVLVESPAKVDKIKSFLGPGYEVLATYGHVRKLPSRAEAVRPAENFAMDFEEVVRTGRAVKAATPLRDIQRALASASELFLATDPDREGEAIAWHVTESLQREIGARPVYRVTFTEITESAVQAAFQSPRSIAAPLLEAQLARLAVDYLFGFTLSPVLWRKMPTARSAGRVQSVALRLVSEREEVVERFVPREFWTIETTLRLPSGQTVPARLVRFRGVSLEKQPLTSRAEAEAALAAVAAASLSVASVKAQSIKRQPAPPYITSTLQQDAVRRLGMSAAGAMRAAQALYEGGMITYMRTDGLNMSEEALQGIRSFAGKRFGAQFLSEEPRRFKSRRKNAQESHECIRPTEARREPSQATALQGPERAVYDLIWRRAVACQMASSVTDRLTVEFAGSSANAAKETKPEEAGDAVVLRATGSQLAFEGYLAVWGGPSTTAEAVEPSEEDAEASASTSSREIFQRLRGVAEGAAVAGDPDSSRDLTQHFTQPPPRFNEASLVKELEELGIGRPSTYTAILSTLIARGYVQKEGKTLVPTPGGRLCSSFLTRYFPRYVDYNFTSALEDQLDEITAERATRTAVLTEFWAPFHAACAAAMDVPKKDVQEAIDEALGDHFFPPRPDGGDPRQCPACKTGRITLLWSPKTGGPFFGCSNYAVKNADASPMCSYSRPFNLSAETEGADLDEDGVPIPVELPRALGTDPATGLPVSLRRGPYGLYVQLGDDTPPAPAPAPESVAETEGSDATAPAPVPKKRTAKKTAAPSGPPLKRSSVPRGTSPLEVSLEMALALLLFPITLGEVEGDPVVVHKGMFGPYVQFRGVNATVPKALEPTALSLQQALELVEAKKAKEAAKEAKRMSEAAAEAAVPAPVAVGGTGRRKKVAAGTAESDREKTGEKAQAAKPAARRTKASTAAAGDKSKGGAEEGKRVVKTRARNLRKGTAVTAGSGSGKDGHADSTDA